MLVILCDGSSKGNPGPASIGVIAWDRINNPKIILPTYRFSKDIGIRTCMEAEWEAMLEAMRYAYGRYIRNEEVYIFCDAQTVIKQATGLWKVKHENIKPLYETFLKLKGMLPKLHILWVPRQLIYLADKAAQKGVEK